MKDRTQRTRFVRHVKVRIGSSLPYVVGGERIGSKTGDDVLYVGSPTGVGSGSDSAQRFISGFGSGNQVEQVHAFFFLSVSVAISTRRVEWTLGLRQVGGLLVVTWSVTVLPHSGHR